MTAPLRLRLDAAALVSNWRTLRDAGGSVACGAAVKADGYGLGAAGVVERLAAAGCRDFFVATWGEARALAGSGHALSVLNGLRAEDMASACAGIARPVLNTPAQVARWREAGGGACDVMVDTGMNRLGLSIAEATGGMLDGMTVETLLTHPACADQDHPLNAIQRKRFAALRGVVPARRFSMANSAAILLGRDYAFDLTRPGVALYGGIPGEAAQGRIRPVVRPQAQVIQRRAVAAGDAVGYNATFVADRPMTVAILNLGYADGYPRALSDIGGASAGGAALPVIGRVSMDMLAVDATLAPSLGEGDWVDIDFDLPALARATGRSQYELLTGLGARFDRVWI